MKSCTPYSLHTSPPCRVPEETKANDEKKRLPLPVTSSAHAAPPLGRQRKFLVIINPKSGAGKASKWFNKHIKPYWEKKNIFCKVVITEAQDHAYRLIQEATKRDNGLKEFDAIITAGGDGLLSEVVRGFQENLGLLHKIPIGVLPCGSGNGLAKSLFQENDDLLGAARIIESGRTSTMDLMKIHCNQREELGFLAVSFGLITKVDLDSEICRCLGGQRFLFGGLKAFIQLPTYRARLSFFEKDAMLQEVLEEDFSLILVSKTTHISYNAYTAPDAVLNDGLLVLTYVKRVPRWQTLKILLGLENGDHLKLKGIVHQKKVSRFAIKTDVPRLFTIDGEKRETDFISGEVLKQKMKVYTHLKAPFPKEEKHSSPANLQSQQDEKS